MKSERVMRRKVLPKMETDDGFVWTGFVPIGTDVTILIHKDGAVGGFEEWMVPYLRAMAKSELAEGGIHTAQAREAIANAIAEVIGGDDV